MTVISVGVAASEEKLGFPLALVLPLLAVVICVGAAIAAASR